MLRSLTCLTDTALRWGQIQARAESRKRVDDLLRERNQLGELIESSIEFLPDNEVEVLRNLQEFPYSFLSHPDLDYLLHRTFREGRLDPAAFAILRLVSGPMSLESVVPQFYEFQMATELEQRAPGPLVVEHLEYSNPLVEILIGAGIILGGTAIRNAGTLAQLLEVIRDWKPRRSQEESKAELMKIYVEQARANPNGLGASHVAELFDLDKETLEAFAQLNQAEITIDSLPEGDNEEPEEPPLTLG